MPADARPPLDGASPRPENVAPSDLSKLPSIDSIGPQTDIRLFLQAGVPATLKRAALRRAWAADPAIRDYIGLSENSWDFTAPDSMPGFGTLDPAAAKKMVAQIFQHLESPDPDERAADETVAKAGEPGATPYEPQVEDAALRLQIDLPAEEAKSYGEDAAPILAASEASATALPVSVENAATQHAQEDGLDASPRKRLHGGALPK